MDDESILKVLVTHYLIRAGGRTRISSEDWEAAIEHASTLFIHRDDEDGHMEVLLVPKKEARA